MPRYRQDPRWITLKYAARCSKCGESIAKGARAYWYPGSRSIYGDACGCARDQERDFESHRQDEDEFTNASL